MTFVLCIILALCLARVQYLSTQRFDSPWNGYGVIDYVKRGEIEAPMVYRVLIPWLIGSPTMAKYQALQIALITAALYSVFLAWGLPVMLISSVLITGTFMYDYWDWTAELIGFSLAFVSLPLAIVGVIIHGLSRETAPLVGIAYALHFRDVWGGVAIAVLGVTVLWLVRRVQGKHKLYCERWMAKRNWKELINPRLGTPWYSAALSIVALIGAYDRLDGLIVLPVIAVGWLMAVASETRVFIPVIPFAAHWLLRMV